MAVKIWKMSSKHSNDKALGNKMHKKIHKFLRKKYQQENCKILQPMLTNMRLYTQTTWEDGHYFTKLRYKFSSSFPRK